MKTPLRAVVDFELMGIEATLKGTRNYSLISCKCVVILKKERVSLIYSSQKSSCILQLLSTLHSTLGRTNTFPTGAVRRGADALKRCDPVASLSILSREYRAPEL